MQEFIALVIKSPTGSTLPCFQTFRNASRSRRLLMGSVQRRRAPSARSLRRWCGWQSRFHRPLHVRPSMQTLKIAIGLLRSA
jgi:hypothetical protein